MKKIIPTLPLFCFITVLCLGQEEVYDVPRISGNINFDGKVDEAIWDEIPILPLVMHSPTFGAPPSEKAEIFLTYDDQYLYLAGRLHLSKAEYLRPTTYKRDAFDGTTDYFGLILDTFHDKENALAFFTGPTGFRWDGTVFNDAEGDVPMSLDWNTFWDVITHIGESYWSAEMRIPWSSLRFQDINGEVTMGVTSWWYIAAKNEVVIYPATPPNWGEISSWKPSQMQSIRFKDVYSKKPLYIAPYVLFGSQQDHELSGDETHYLKQKDPTFNIGLDLKYGLTNNLTLDLTVNTDFAQVEVDDQQVR